MDCSWFGNSENIQGIFGKNMKRIKQVLTLFNGLPSFSVVNFLPWRYLKLHHRLFFLEIFDTVLEKFDEVSADKMSPSQKIGLLKQAAHADKQLLQAWTAVEIIVSHGSTSGTATMSEKYMEYLVSHSEILEASKAKNSKRKINLADTHFIELYLPEDSS